MTTTPASTKTTRARRAVPRSAYQAEFAEQARKLCLLMSADDQELKRFFDVPPATLQEWLASAPEFAAAVRAGRTLADADVADRLWRRAIGYSHDAVRIFSHQGKAPYTLSYYVQFELATRGSRDKKSVQVHRYAFVTTKYQFNEGTERLQGSWYELGELTTGSIKFERRIAN